MQEMSWLVFLFKLVKKALVYMFIETVTSNVCESIAYTKFGVCVVILILIFILTNSPYIKRAWSHGTTIIT